METTTRVGDVPDISKRAAAILKKQMGIETAKDLIFCFPRRHEDYSTTATLAEAKAGSFLSIVANVTAIKKRHGFRRKMTMLEAILDDGTDTLTAIWFNQHYAARAIVAGAAFRFSGKVGATKFGLRLMNPTFEPIGAAESAFTHPFVPVYALPTGVSQQTMRKAVLACIGVCSAIEDPLSGDIRAKYSLAPLHSAVRAIHFPASMDSLQAARRRMGFDEMLAFQLSLGNLRRQRVSAPSIAIPFKQDVIQSFVKSLPFTLTADQKRAAWDALQDMEKPAPMSRLLNGDVGSGKTAVAAIAACSAITTGVQIAMMAPTEILARQHYETFTKKFALPNASIALWTNAYKKIFEGGEEIDCKGAAGERELASRVAVGDISLVIGTHALIEEAVKFRRLGLVIIDEQHRFGVRARQLLAKKTSGGAMPHLLSMSATPIPRSLALTLFGDLDISLLKTKPAARKPIRTSVIESVRRPMMFDAVRREIAKGRQAFIVCPAIEINDAMPQTTVTEEFEKLQKGELKGIPIAMLHGKMEAKEKERVMSDFVGGKIKVLVSTSVIEVGVDVPNASVMCILGAERFGLAQLHQFRGRVGRGADESFCFLMSDAETESSRERLDAFQNTDDGFALAELDLRQRGPGDILGDAQSGYPEFAFASVFDVTLIREAREAAEAILDDPKAKRDAFMPRRLEKAHLE